MRRIVPLLVLLTACGAAPEDVDSLDEALSPTSPVSAALSASCSTDTVQGLSQQLVDEMNCLKPGTLQSIKGLPKVSLVSGVFPYLQAPAVSGLTKAVAARGTTLTVNSAFRTLPEQYLLYHYYLQGRCGIALAASPGNSNHESGLALDIQDHTGWQSALESHGWKWLGSKDVVHFDFVSGGIDLRSLSVLAFQKLWNENHPGDLLAEDGAYGPQTEGRLTQSPVGGFAKGATCTATDPDAGKPETDAGAADAAAEPYAGDAADDASAPPAPDAGTPEIPSGGGCSSSGQAPSSTVWGALALALALVSRRRGVKRGGPRGRA